MSVAVLLLAGWRQPPPGCACPPTYTITLRLHPALLLCPAFAPVSPLPACPAPDHLPRPCPAACLQYERRSQFDRIVIETTGLAQPAPIIQTFFLEPSVADRMKLDGVVTLVGGWLVCWLGVG